ncbi:MAG: YbhB/YbcL family Raf kinase inhibitor-like protein [Spirochaetia bacterium]|jgi:Raf kinase inhibitor-like YbhB/YbcL family protein|nr:YbhB/YbcL family Raf kinase inhibitor-like protein [Spirochaetia bacterium]
MVLTSVEFAAGSWLPFDSSYESANRSPSLSWTDVPMGVRSYALTCQDQNGPDGQAWTHWLLWNIPATESRVLSGLAQYPRLDNGMEQGLNDYLDYGWSGPCPPLGVHEYIFTLYALDSDFSPTSASPASVISELASVAMTTARLTALYGSGGHIMSLASIGQESRAAYRQAVFLAQSRSA